MISSLNRALAGWWLAALVACIAYPALSADAPAPPAPCDSAQVPADGEPPAESTVSPFTPVQTQALGQVDAKLAGLLDSSNGGFDADVWSGTNRLVVEALLPQLPAAQGSPAMTALARRLLLSKAQPPQGATHNVPLLAVRLDRAIAIGQVSAVEPMAAQVPAELDSPPVLGARVDALLYQASDADACKLAERARGKTGNSAAWAKRLAYCSALAGKVAEARLASDVLGDTGDTDEAFTALMAKLVDKAKIKPVRLSAPSAVHFALLRTTASALDDASLAKADPAFLMAWSAYDKAPLAQRLAAAERAVSSGALPASALITLYGKAKVKPEFLAAPFNPKIMPSGVAGAAYVVQRVAKSSDPPEQGHLIAAALSASKSRGALPGVAAALRTPLTHLEPSSALADVAATLGVGAVMAGDDAVAKRWLDLIRAQGAADTEPGRALHSLLAVRGVADAGWTADMFLVRLNGAAEADKRRAAVEWSLLRALGASSSDAISIASFDAPLSQSATSPMPAVMDGLRAAASQGRVAETAMFALIALGDGGPRATHPTPLASIVAALAKVGLMSDARAIAAEALATQMP